MKTRDALFWCAVTILAALYVIFSLPAEAQALHSNDLTWIASPSAATQPALVYNIYKFGMAPGSTCPTALTPTVQTLIATVGPNVLTYTDTVNLVDGGVSCYEVTASAVGFESSPSNLVQAVTPLALAAPSGLVVTKSK